MMMLCVYGMILLHRMLMIDVILRMRADRQRRKRRLWRAHGYRRATVTWQRVCHAHSGRQVVDVVDDRVLTARHWRRHHTERHVAVRVGVALCRAVLAVAEAVEHLRALLARHLVLVQLALLVQLIAEVAGARKHQHTRYAQARGDGNQVARW